MYHYVYMLLTVNSKTSITYVGYSTNPIKRLDRHNRGIGAKFTKGRMWKIIYKKKLKNKIQIEKKLLEVLKALNEDNKNISDLTISKKEIEIMLAKFKEN